MAKYTKQDFVNKSREIHGDKYDYSDTIYIKSSLIVNITCPIHGSFSQRAGHHTSGHGCPHCAGNTQKTTDQFIKEAVDIHDGYYSYKKSKYKSYHKEIIITCPVHGEFPQTPANHLIGKGCRKCGTDRTVRNTKMTFQEFKSKAEKIHNYKYSYPDTNIVNTKTYIEIECPIHGLFPQIPSNHLYGFGCIKCGREVEREGVGFYSVKRAERHKEEWEKIESEIYLIEFYNNKEHFLKVGITTIGVLNRMCYIPYEGKILYSKKDNLYNVAIREQNILKQLKKEKYLPEIKFGGSGECFNKGLKTRLIKKLNEV